MYTRRIAFGRLRRGFFASPAAIWEFPLVTKKVCAVRNWTHGDDLGTNEGKRCLGHDRPSAEETPLRAAYTLILDERTRVFPIAESKAIAIWASTEVEDNSQNDQTCSAWASWEMGR